MCTASMWRIFGTSMPTSNQWQSFLLNPCNSPPLMYRLLSVIFPLCLLYQTICWNTTNSLSNCHSCNTTAYDCHGLSIFGEGGIVQVVSIKWLLPRFQPWNPLETGKRRSIMGPERVVMLSWVHKGQQRISRRVIVQEWKGNVSSSCF